MALVSKVSDFFSSFDIFGITPLLYFKGKAKFGTLFGFFLSFLLLSFTFLCLFFFGQNLYYRRNPVIISNEEYVARPDYYVLDPEKTPFAFELNSPFGDIYYTDSSYMEANISQLTIQKNPTGPPNVTWDHYRMEICEDKHFVNLDSKTDAYFKNMNLKDYFCIPPYLKNLTMEGAFDQPLFKAVRITFSMCKNNSYSENKCKPIEQIKSYMGRGFVGMYFKDYTLNLGDYQDFKTDQPKEVFTNWVLDSQKEIDVFFLNNYLETEDGVVFDQSFTNKIVNYDHYKEFNFMVSDNDFLFIYLRIEQKKTNYQRSYPKLQDLLAQIGGFINTFFIALAFINVMHTKIVFIRDIIFDVFVVKNVKKVDYKGSSNFIPLESPQSHTPEKKHEPKDKKPLKKKSTFHKVKHNLVKDKDSIDTQPKEKIFEESERKEIVKSPRDIGFIPQKTIENQEKEIDIENSHFSKELDSEIIVEDSPEVLKSSPNDNEPLSPLQKFEMNGEEISFFKFGIADYLYYYTGLRIFRNTERERKKLILLKGEKILHQSLDVKFIIQKFYEIEKLKQLLLTEEQLEIFNSLPKPEIAIVSDDNNSTNNKKSLDVITTVLSRRVSVAGEKGIKKYKTIGESISKKNMNNSSRMDKQLMELAQSEKNIQN